jgi:hypothetical protein
VSGWEEWGAHAPFSWGRVNALESVRGLEACLGEVKAKVGARRVAAAVRVVAIFMVVYVSNPSKMRKREILPLKFKVSFDNCMIILMLIYILYLDVAGKTRTSTS